MLARTHKDRPVVSAMVRMVMMVVVVMMMMMVMMRRGSRKDRLVVPAHNTE